MAFDDYTQNLRQWRVGLRWPIDAENVPELWAMNFDIADAAQRSFTLGAAIDAYVFFGDPIPRPGYLRIATATEEPIGTFAEDCDELRLVIRPRHNFDAPPFLEVTVTAPSEVTVDDLAVIHPTADQENLILSTAPVKAYALPFTLDGPLLREVFAGISTASLEATLQLSYVRAGLRSAIRPVAILITA